MTWRYYQYEFRASLRHACKHQGLIHTFIEKQTQTTYTLILAFFVPVLLYVLVFASLKCALGLKDYTNIAAEKFIPGLM